jgi:hypothetical protein
MAVLTNLKCCGKILASIAGMNDSKGGMRCIL